MWAALFHDLGESVTGDVPAVAKWESPKLDELLEEWEDNFHTENGTYITLSDNEVTLLSLADKLELVWFCTEQLLLGNRNAERIRERGIEYCLHLGHDNGDINNRIRYFIGACEHECK